MNKTLHPNRWFIWCVLLCILITSIIFWQLKLFLLEQDRLTYLVSESVVSVPDTQKIIAEETILATDTINENTELQTNSLTFNSSEQTIWKRNKNGEDKFTIELTLEDKTVVPPTFYVNIIDPSTISVNFLDGMMMGYDTEQRKCYWGYLSPSRGTERWYESELINGYTYCSARLGDAGYSSEIYYIISPDGTYAISLSTGGDEYQEHAPINTILQTIKFTQTVEGGYDFSFTYPDTFILKKSIAVRGDGRG